MAKEAMIISLGGSLVVPDGIDIPFLRAFRDIILKHAADRRFVIIVGGGKTARNYIGAAREGFGASLVEQDLLGIACTRLNANLLRLAFGEKAHHQVVEDPTKNVKTKKDIIIAAGWKPGCSTDYDAVMLAKSMKVNTVVNLSNIDRVYDSDPRYNPEAKAIDRIGWANFRKIVGNKWISGLNSPFDPVASALAQKLGLKVIIASGRNLDNVERIISGDRFVGTVVDG